MRVRATAVNRADLLQRMGAYPAPPDAPPDIPGLEIAGEVDALGAGVERLAVGDRVFGLVGGGALRRGARRARARAREDPRRHLASSEAAAIPEAFVTAHDAMVTQAQLRGGETLLVHAVGSGVGTAAAQLGRALGAYVVGTARTRRQARAREGARPGSSASCRRTASSPTPCARAPAAPARRSCSSSSAAPTSTRICAARSRAGASCSSGCIAGARTELDLGAAAAQARADHRHACCARARSRRRSRRCARSRRRSCRCSRAASSRPVVDTRDAARRTPARRTRDMASNAGFGKIVLTS